MHVKNGPQQRESSPYYKTPPRQAKTQVRQLKMKPVLKSRTVTVNHAKFRFCRFRFRNFVTAIFEITNKIVQSMGAT